MSKPERAGRFTASVFGQLTAEPKSLSANIIEKYAHLVPEEQAWKIIKSGPRKGQQVRSDRFNDLLKDAMSANGIVLFGDTAMSLIASKAGELLGEAMDYSPDTRSTDRGTLLEHAARIILSNHWLPMDGCGWQPYGENCGATPDTLLVRDETETNDFKCPEKFGDVLLFNELPDGDFDELVKWNRTYAWQLMVQAKASGTRYANLTYFTDRLHIHDLDPGERDHVQSIMDAVAYQMGEATGRPWGYTYASDGFAFASKRYELTEERSAYIDRVLNAAVIERDRLVEKNRKPIPVAA